MDLSEFDAFVKDNNGKGYYGFSTLINHTATSLEHFVVKFNYVFVNGQAKAISFSNPVISIRLDGVTHIERTDLDSGEVQFEITCEDNLINNGGKYVEKIIWVPVRKSGF